MSAPPRRRPRTLAAAPKPPRAKRRDTGGAFQRAVFAALDDCVRDGVFVRWDHFGEETRRIAKGAVIVVGNAPPDVIATTAQGFSYAAEVKHDGERVYVATAPKSSSHRARVEPHQAEYLDSVAETEHGSADLIVCVGGEVAVIPWLDVRRRPWLDRADVAAFAAADPEGAWFLAMVRRRMTVVGL